MIQAVIFDIGGVLIKEPAKSREEYCARKLKVPLEKFVKAYKRLLPDFTMGKISEEEFWQKISEELKIKKPEVGLWQEGLMQAYQENTKVFEIVFSLKLNGYKTAVISNTEMPSLEYFKEEYLKIFDACIYSCEEGAAKPEEKIYRIALEKLNVEPEEAVFIDDKQEHINGAEKLGIKTILFKNAEQLARDLISYDCILG